MKNLSRDIPSLFKMKAGLILLFILSFFQTEDSLAQHIIINEVAWMGTASSAQDEWIELFNNTALLISIDGWQLEADDEVPSILLSGTIPPYGFFLLERTDDNTVPNITASQIYSGALNNHGENLTLIDSKGNIIDKVESSQGWPAGDNKNKQTMAKYSCRWETSADPGGTPGKENILPNPVKETIKTDTVNFPKKIVFNEIFPSSKGPDQEDEWIEIANYNNFKVSLAGWTISDTTGKTKEYIFPETAVIEPLGLLLISRQESNITLNNSGDELLLVNPQGELSDKISYPKSLLGKSYALYQEKWSWSDIPTPGKKNAIDNYQLTSSQEELSFDNPANGEDIVKTISNTGKSSALIPINTAVIPGTNSSFKPALLTAILWGAIIVLMKKKFYRKKQV